MNKFIEKVKLTYDDKYDLSKIIYKNLGTKLIIIYKIYR